MAIIKSELRPKKEDGTYGDVVYLKTSYDLIEGAPKVRNSLEEITTGNALDATQGKVLKTAIESKANVIHTHTSSEITGIPTSLPANGGNSDTVDGLHANAFVLKEGGSLGYSDDRLVDVALLTPVYYVQNNRSGITLQLLSASQVGLTGTSLVHARTEIPWKNTTGGNVTQYISGSGKEYVRYGNGDSTWSVPKLLGEGCNADTVDGKHATDFIATTGGTMTGALNLPNSILNKIGDDVLLGDGNVAGQVVIQGTNGNTGIAFKPYSGTVQQSITTDGSGTMSIGNNVAIGNRLTAIDVVTTGANAFRSVYGNYGVFLRNDGNNTYLMITNSGDAYGGYSTLRPFSFAHNTGDVTLSHNVTIGGNLGTGNQLTIGNSNGNVKRTTISTATPSGGANGDVWIRYS